MVNTSDGHSRALATPSKLNRRSETATQDRPVQWQTQAMGDNSLRLGRWPVVVQGLRQMSFARMLSGLPFRMASSAVFDPSSGTPCRVQRGQGGRVPDVPLRADHPLPRYAPWGRKLLN